MHLLENQRFQGGILLFGRPLEIFCKETGKLMNGQLGQDVFPEQTGPRFG